MLGVFLIMSAAGAMCRFAVERASLKRWGERFPWGTLAANVVGSFLLGVSVGWPDRTTELVAIQAFCGAFTTFGGFIGQSWTRLRHAESFRRGWGYLIVTVVASIAAAATGMALTNQH